MFEKVKIAGKKFVNEVSTEWNSRSGLDKAKLILKGMVFIGCGWMGGHLVDTEHGKIIAACTYVAATGLGTAGASLACSGIDLALDSWSSIADDVKKEFEAEKETT